MVSLLTFDETRHSWIMEKDRTSHWKSMTVLLEYEVGYTSTKIISTM